MLHEFSVKEIKDLNVLLKNENGQLKWELDQAHKETIKQRHDMELKHKEEMGKMHTQYNIVS